MINTSSIQLNKSDLIARIRGSPSICLRRVFCDHLAKWQYVIFEFTIVFRPKGRPPHFRASNYETISIIRSLVLLFRWRGLLYYIYIQIPHTHTLAHLHNTHNRHLYSRNCNCNCNCNCNFWILCLLKEWELVCVLHCYNILTHHCTYSQSVCLF